jgi:hypothetical protein
MARHLRALYHPRTCSLRCGRPHRHIDPIARESLPRSVGMASLVLCRAEVRTCGPWSTGSVKQRRRSSACGPRTHVRRQAAKAGRILRSSRLLSDAVMRNAIGMPVERIDLRAVIGPATTQPTAALHIGSMQIRRQPLPPIQVVETRRFTTRRDAGRCCIGQRLTERACVHQEVQLKSVPASISQVVLERCNVRGALQRTPSLR